MRSILKIELYSIFLLLFFTGTFILSPNSYALAKTSHAPNKLDFKNPIIEKKILKNGMTVLLRDNNQANDIIAVEILVKAGSIYEGKWQGSGVSHLVEHMLFKGTENYPAGKIEKEVKILGGKINGYVNHQFSGYSLELPARHLNKGLELLADMVFNPAFIEQEIENEKDVILSEIRMNKDDPIRYLQRIFWQQMYPIAPYNLPVIGFDPIFLSLRREDLLNYHKKWYVPNNMIISIAGDLSRQDVFEYVKNTFEQYPMKPFPKEVIPRLIFTLKSMNTKIRRPLIHPI